MEPQNSRRCRALFNPTCCFVPDPEKKNRLLYILSPSFIVIIFLLFIIGEVGSFLMFLCVVLHFLLLLLLLLLLLMIQLFCFVFSIPLKR